MLLIFFSEASSITIKNQTSGTLIRHALLCTRICLEHMAFRENGKFERIMFDTRTLLQEQRFHEHLRIYIVKKNTLSRLEKDSY